LRRGWFLLALCSVAPWCAGAAAPVRYLVDLRTPETHRVHVTMEVTDARAGTEIQIPTWNCLYQIRDFVKDVEDLRGDCDGQPVALRREDLNTWRGPDRSCRNLTFHYSVYADADGPFDSMLDFHHSFLNLAMILFYLPEERQRAVQVAFQAPAGWKVASLLEDEGGEVKAANYDALVDSPVEAGTFEDLTYQQNLIPPGAAAAEAKSATFRVIIDAERSDYSPERILHSLQKITAEEMALMQDLPFRRYTFILHFPREGGGTGGMEHAYGTAIAVPASEVRENGGALESVVAHEFFHAWNVKRIRPQALEPVDYIRGNDTRDLWLAEGVTSTYAQLVLLRAGLIDRATFYNRVAGAIEVLQNHAARRLQSVETSGREAWLEKYSDYNRRARSISYYNKGELLGYLLDLGMRHATRNEAGLDDLMRTLNQDYAQRGRFYTPADLIEIISRLAPAFDAKRFFADYVEGREELDYAAYFGYAGLSVSTRTTESAQPGFSASTNDAGLLQVDSVDDAGDAARAGLRPGDIVVAADGQPLAGAHAALPSWPPRQDAELQIKRDGETHTLRFRVGANPQVAVQIQEAAHAGAEQLRVRDGWLQGVTRPPHGKP
jgi:predicted metalloprotease with PDZ domain